MAIIIRKATGADVDPLTDLRLEIARYHQAFDNYYTLPDDVRPMLKKHLQMLLSNDDTCILVAVEGNTIQGLITGKVGSKHPLFNAPPIGIIDEMGVSAHSRNKGIGTQLLSALQQWFTARQISRIELKVYAPNHTGRNFWQKHGFVERQIGMSKEG